MARSSNTKKKKKTVKKKTKEDTGVNTGEWTRKESKQFETLFIKYGDKKWAKIASEIPTRDNKQVFKYADYLFTRHPAEKKRLISLYEANKDKVDAPGRWTDEDKKQFETAFVKHGMSRWAQIAAEIPTKDNHQVRNYAVQLFKNLAEKKRLISLYEANEDKVTVTGPVVRQRSKFAGSESKIAFGVASTRDLAIAVKPELDTIRDSLEDSIQREQKMSPAEKKLTSEVGDIITGAFHSNQSAESAGAFAAHQIMQLLENRKTSAI